MRLENNSSVPVPAGYLYPSTKIKARKNDEPVLKLDPEVVNVLVGETYTITDGIRVTDSDSSVSSNDV